jgi:uncharacterized protein (TIGR00251 family)
MRYFVSVRFSSDGRIEVSGNEITVSIKSPPERGKANRELVKRLADYFGLDIGRIVIVSGYTSRKKVVEVSK